MIKNKWTGEYFDVNKCNPAQTGPGKFNPHGAILNSVDYQYHSLIEKILEEGLWKQNRTGVRTLSIFGPQVQFDYVGSAFPLLTTKKIHLKSVIGELLWFLSGSTNKHVLKDKYETSIWDEWGDDETGELGPIYGHQWVNWEYDTSYKMTGSEHGAKFTKSINQLQGIIDTLKTNPDDRRMIVSAWHVEQIPDMALPPCHWSYQFYSNQYPLNEKRTLHLLWNQRSVDTGLGLPFNIASYAMLLMMVAQQVDMIPGSITGNLGDTHIYENHMVQLSEQLSRNSKLHPPKLKIEKQKDLWSYKPEHFHIEKYESHPSIKMPVAV